MAYGPAMPPAGRSVEEGGGKEVNEVRPDVDGDPFMRDVVVVVVVVGAKGGSGKGRCRSGFPYETVRPASEELTAPEWVVARAIG